MQYRLLADMVVLFHVAFLVFVVLGGFLVLRWGWVAWMHLPSAVWGTLIELFGWVCPLTPLEIRFRQLGGEAGYSTSFLEHYLMPILYPTHLTRGIQVVLGVLVLALNLGIYAWVFARRKRGGVNP